MASRIFPDSGSRYADRPNGDQASNGVIVYFRDAAGQNRAPVYAERGTDNPPSSDALVNSETHLDAYGGQLDFRGPNDDTDLLYASVDGGPIFRVPAAPEPRLRTLEDLVADLLVATTELDARMTSLEVGPPEVSGFSLDDDNPVYVYASADSVFPGITTDGDVLVVDTILATGATTDGDVLVLTV